MTIRFYRNKKLATTRIGKHILKVRLFPWMYTSDGCVWLASMAISKSNRQLNDWTAQKKNKRVRSLNSSMTGRYGMGPQLKAIHKVREWMKEIPIGDSITLRCEAVLDDKQFKIWKKWFLKNESKEWTFSEKHKAFFFYRAE